MSILIEATTGVVAASKGTQIYVERGSPVTLSATALDGANEVDIEYSGNGDDWVTAYNYDDGTALTLTATKPQIELTGVGHYRIAKDATTIACAVHILR